MLRFAVPIILSLAAITNGIHYHPSPFYSAASEAQLRFALENKYDDTGPGAKEPEYAYNTYKTLEDALVGYLDDPDTKLPENERSRAVEHIVNRPIHDKPILKRYYPKTVEEYTGYNEQKSQHANEFSRFEPPTSVEIVKGYRQPQPQSFVLAKLKKYHPASSQDSGYRQKDREVAEPYRFQIVKKQPFKASPLDSTQYLRNADYQSASAHFDPHPKYAYSYGVHAADTGDSKSAHETREGGVVHGYYSFVDPTGELRTVRYTANDEQGFRATVHRGQHDH